MKSSRYKKALDFRRAFSYLPKLESIDLFGGFHGIDTDWWVRGPGGIYRDAQMKLLQNFLYFCTMTSRNENSKKSRWM
jgi:hypothetical protein